LDIAAALVEGADLGGVYVEAGDVEAGFAEEQREGQADVAEADDRDAGFAGFDGGGPVGECVEAAQGFNTCVPLIAR
jgi:hypothetical protein